MAGVLLGTIQFVDREVPDSIRFGGKQMLAIHRQMGGARVIDAMGPDPEPITWAGKFYGPSAAQRARMCDALRQSGSQVSLNWGSFSYQVVVSDFEATYKHEWEIRYRITCEVVSDGQGGGGSFTSIDDVLSQDFAAINTMISAAPALPAVSGSQTLPQILSSALAAAQLAIKGAAGQGSIADVSLSGLAPVIAATQSAFAIVSAGSGVPVGLNLDAGADASVLDGFNAFASEANLVASESDSELATAYLGRILANLTTLGG